MATSAEAQGESRLLHLDLAAYYSNVFQKIVQIQVPNPEYTAVTMGYTVNLDAMWGIEAGMQFTPVKFLTLGGAFSWNKYSITHSELGVETLPLYPEITANAYLLIQPIEALVVNASVQYTGSRCTGTNGGPQLDGYFLLNLKASYAFLKHFSISLAVDNVFDTLYYIREYYPMSGRQYSATFSVKY